MAVENYSAKTSPKASNSRTLVYIGKSLDLAQLAELAKLPDLVNGGDLLDISAYPKDSTKSKLDGTALWRTAMAMVLIAYCKMDRIKAYATIDSICKF
jgi:hypothetical protein